jgi:hypothetical protein
MKIWLDDKRPMPDGYDMHCVSAYQVITYINKGDVTEVSLDHDLGNEEIYGTGYMVAKAIEEAAFHGYIKRLKWRIHSQNSVGVATMRQALENADRYWTAGEEDQT